VLIGRDKRVPPNLDVTSTSLRKIGRGALVVPGEREWMIERYPSDPTSGSLRKRNGTEGATSVPCAFADLCEAGSKPTVASR